MSTARLSASDITTELRSALAEGGWLPAVTQAAGPGPLSAGAPLSEIACALRTHSNAIMLPSAAADLLERAAQAVTAAQQLEPDGADLYGQLGAAFAYLVQAHRAFLIASAVHQEHV
ncbi:hypothetical protein [Streptomyces marianii]|uniref:Uncharacterized protein n=1 Tax=Streptomyces marianii TaxID=1817406 RepID=A0A5R9DVD0_9ACTN|nr:hypothetical protein [Streptomyces marianii]TLQ38992.1 hypothetical protein FEF34_39965 [Streptomyces marianii]